MITIEDLKKVDIRIGHIRTAERVPETDKLVRLEVDFNEGEARQVISGVAEFFDDVSELVDVKCPFITNLEPRMIRGLESQAMIFAAHTEDGKFALLEPSRDDIPAGTQLI